MKKHFAPFLLVLLIACDAARQTNDLQEVPTDLVQNDTAAVSISHIQDVHKDLPPTTSIDTRDVQPDALLNFAKTLIGVPYKYASVSPHDGFDCSGFITYVFNHFEIAVPRSSIDFTNVGRQVNLTDAHPGDVILFTGTDSAATVVGHMGIIVENTDSLRFIHSTSGRANGVTITTLNGYYQKRFVKINHVFK